MKTPEEISSSIRHDFYRRYGSIDGRGLTEECLDALIVDAVSPLCQRIESLQEAIRDTLDYVNRYNDAHFTEEHIARLRAIIEETEVGSE